MKPQGIIARLADADRAFQRIAAWELFLGSVKFLALGVLVLVAADLVGQLSAPTRGTLTCVAVVTGLGFAAYLLWRAYRRSQPVERTARMLESRDATLGSKLMNVLQLDRTAQNDAEPPLTRSLARQAVEQAGQALADRDFCPLMASPTLGRSTRWAFGVLGGMIALFVAFWSISSNEFLRYVDPMGDHPPFSFTHLAITTPGQDGLKVIYKKPIVVEAAYSGHRPSELYLSVENAANAQKPMLLPLYPEQGQKFTQQIDEVTSDLVLRAQTRSLRSVSAWRHVKVILTPQLEKATVTIQPPAYTKLPSHRMDFTPSGGSQANLSALEGSTLTFAFRSNRPLSGGTLALQSAETGAAEAPLLPGKGAEESQASGSMSVKESGRFRFEIRDVTQLPNDGEWSAGLTVTHDLPPEISITEPAQDGFIVDTFAAKIVFNATDDYGLKNLRLHAGVNGEFKEPQVIECGQDPPSRHAVESLRITPRDMGATPGSVITVFGEATDIRPEPQLSRSRTLKLEVITEDQYNQFLRTRTEIQDLKNKYSAYNKELHQLMEKQRELAKQAEELAKSKDAVSKEKRDELAAAQAELNNKLDSLADRMNRASREKPLYDLEKEFQKRLDEESEKIRNSIAENEGKLGDFVQKPPGAQTMQDFKQAATEQADRLEPMGEETEKKISDTLDDAQKMQDLLKPLNAFERLYQQQKEIASQTSAYRSKPSLSEADRLSLQNLASEEHKMSAELQKIIEDLKAAAQRAKDTYPEAADDARNLAQQMDDATLPPLATQSAQSMLSGHGPDSYEKAEHLREEMDKLFKDGCSKCRGHGGEFAQRLALIRQMAAGETFDQMDQFGKPGFGRGQQGGGGTGFGGMYADGAANGTQQSLLGDENMLGHPNQESANSSHGKAESPEAPVAERSNRDAEKRENGPSPSLRPTQSSGATTVLDEYNSLVDAYFRRLTTPDKHP